MRCFSSPGLLPKPMNSVQDDPKGPGFPIRKSADHRVLAPPRSLSQRATSFVASQCQGIHQMPLYLTLDRFQLSCVTPREQRIRAQNTDYKFSKRERSSLLPSILCSLPSDTRSLMSGYRNSKTMSSAALCLLLGTRKSAAALQNHPLSAQSFHLISGFHPIPIAFDLQRAHTALVSSSQSSKHRQLPEDPPQNTSSPARFRQNPPPGGPAFKGPMP